MELQDALEVLKKPTLRNKMQYKKMQFQIDIPTAKKLESAIDYYGQNKSSFLRKAINYFISSLEHRIIELEEEC